MAFALVLLLLGNCDAKSLKNGFGEKCHEVIQISQPYRKTFPTKFGGIIQSGYECHRGTMNISGQCEAKNLVVINCESVEDRNLCHEKISVSDPYMRVIPSKWGPVQTGLFCERGQFNNVSGKCEYRYLIP